MSGVDGPSLRALRRQHGISLREMARQTGISHGQLAKIERGETRRPISRDLVLAYERATSTTLTHGERGETRDGWRIGQLDDNARRAFTGRVAAAAWGAPPEDRLDWVVANRCRLPLPNDIDLPQVAQLAQLATALASQDGRLPGLVAREILAWTAKLVVRVSEQAHSDLYAVVAVLAKRAARSGVEVGDHEVARRLELEALQAAAVADAPDLRAQVIADIAGHLHALGHYADAREVARLGEVDERVTDETRKLLHRVKTRAADIEQQTGDEQDQPS